MPFGFERAFAYVVFNLVSNLAYRKVFRRLQRQLL